MVVMTFRSTADYRTIEMAMHAFDERVRKFSAVDASEEVSLGDEIAARVGLSREDLDSTVCTLGRCPPDPVPALSELEPNPEEVSGDQKPAGGFSAVGIFRDWQCFCL